MENLTQLYKELNRQFFNGRLPCYRVTFYKPLVAQGHCISERRLIRLSPGMSDAEVRKVLLHEMCHIGTPNHGKRFLAKLARLAAMGEAWATEEIEIYSGPYRNLQSQVKEQIFDALIDAPDAHFWPMIRWIANDLGMTAGELLRKAPWVRREWKKAKAEARRQARIHSAQLAELGMNVTTKGTTNGDPI